MLQLCILLVKTAYPTTPSGISISHSNHHSFQTQSKARVSDFDRANRFWPGQRVLTGSTGFDRVVGTILFFKSKRRRFRKKTKVNGLQLSFLLGLAESTGSPGQPTGSAGFRGDPPGRAGFQSYANHRKGRQKGASGFTHSFNVSYGWDQDKYCSKTKQDKYSSGTSYHAQCLTQSITSSRYSLRASFRRLNFSQQTCSLICLSVSSLLHNPFSTRLHCFNKLWSSIEEFLICILTNMQLMKK
jgi:hypothetical protein